MLVLLPARSSRCPPGVGRSWGPPSAPLLTPARACSTWSIHERRGCGAGAPVPRARPRRRVTPSGPGVLRRLARRAVGFRRARARRRSRGRGVVAGWACARTTSKAPVPRETLRAAMRPRRRADVSPTTSPRPSSRRCASPWSSREGSHRPARAPRMFHVKRTVGGRVGALADGRMRPTRTQEETGGAPRLDGVRGRSP